MPKPKLIAKLMSNGFCKVSLLIILSALVIFFGSFNAAAQTVTATGTVVDSSTGEPLIGAVVLLKAKSSTDHVITDLDGRFSLRAPAGSLLEISLMGYVGTVGKCLKSFQLS